MDEKAAIERLLGQKGYRYASVNGPFPTPLYPEYNVTIWGNDKAPQPLFGLLVGSYSQLVTTIRRLPDAQAAPSHGA